MSEILIQYNNYGFLSNFSNVEVIIDSTEPTLTHAWCTYCGGWHGGGPPPDTKDGDTRPTPSVPEVLGKIIGKTIQGDRSINHQRVSVPRWQRGGFVNGQPAKIKVDGDKLEALWGGENPDGDGSHHGHLVSHDGINANLIAEPGADKNRRDTPVNDWRIDPYDQNSPSAPTYDHDEKTGYTFD